MAKKRTKKNRILRVAFAAFFVYVIVSFAVMQVDIAHRRELLENANEELMQQNYLNDEILSLLNSGENADYIMRIARERFGFAFPNERVIIDYKRK